jgi:phosphatidylethanolamine-binding protein (PEBP) family uncharacterized protein
MRTPTPTLALTLTLMLGLTGCATSTSTSTTPNGSPAQVTLTIPTLTQHTLPAQYTCDGHNTTPPFQWTNIPPGTSELALYALGINPTPQHTYNITVEWALAGINPALTHLNPGEQPLGTHSGLNANNQRTYNICPPKDKTTHRYQFMLFAIPKTIKINPEFNALEILTAITSKNTEYTATSHGTYIALYKRK